MREKIINGRSYLRLAHIIEATGVEGKTLTTWLQNGELVHFLTIYRNKKSGRHYYRLGRPEPDDILVAGETYIYELPEEDKGK